MVQPCCLVCAPVYAVVLLERRGNGSWQRIYSCKYNCTSVAQYVKLTWPGREGWCVSIHVLLNQALLVNSE
jgi:hypothetical protein